MSAVMKTTERLQTNAIPLQKKTYAWGPSKRNIITMIAEFITGCQLRWADPASQIDPPQNTNFTGLLTRHLCAMLQVLMVQYLGPRCLPYQSPQGPHISVANCHLAPKSGHRQQSRQESL